MLEIKIPESLKALDDRLGRRFSSAPDTADFLPEEKVDLDAMESMTVEKLTSSKDGRRVDMAHQIRLLSKIFAGRSELEFLHAVVISYLRRDTPHTRKAWHLFRRLWQRKPISLLKI
ncbi:hypothetical protein [Gemmobacter sp. 24YEA27]|uniref:hypothetical protein n=1 Tax=Gemmobacter sp. 24YEA27 TaxID=3040672 RepID=UPI0024B37700|nr:hypothetical protein [Gemmobacter sp. 24YEA27]